MKFGICNEIFRDWDLGDAMRFAKSTGYDGIEIAPFTIAPHVTDIPQSQRAEIRQMARDCGIEISGIHWVLVGTEGMHLTHPEVAVRKRTTQYLVDLVRFCSDLGGRRIVVGSPKQRSLMPGVDYTTAWQWALEAFKPAVQEAEKTDVVICFEPLAPSETDFVNTAEEAIRFAKSFNSPAMSVILDVKAMSSEAIPIDQIIRSSHPNFAYFHANDANLKGPGFGNTDFRPIATALKEVGYEGYVSVEVFDFTEGPEVIASKSLEHLKQVFS